MKILCFLSGSILSGKEYVALDAIDGWLRAGHDVQVAFVGWHDGKFKQKLQERNVVCHPIKLGWYYIRNIKWSIDSLIHYPGAVRSFIRLQKNFSPDVLYVDSFRPLVLLAPFIKTKIMFHVHEAITFSANQKMFIKPINKRVHKYIAVSDFIKKDLIAAGATPEKITIIRNALQLKTDAPRQYMPQSILRIGIVGQILESKGHTDMLTACAMLRNAAVLYRLFIFGSGNEAYIQELKALAQQYAVQDDIEWVGYVADKASIYNTVDVVVIPSRCDEAFSLVAIEAAAYRLPVIATISGALPENVINNITGILINKESPKDLFNALIKLYSNPAEIDRIGTSARNHVVQNFQLAAMQAAMNQVLNN